MLVERELDTVFRLYSGPSRANVSALVRAAAPHIDASVKEHFQTALADVSALQEPLEKLVLTNPDKLVRARDSAKALDLALKVDVASALGLTLTFQAGDAD